MPINKNAETLSTASNKFAKALQIGGTYRGPPKVEEIYQQGSTGRVNKVTSLFDIEYCVYTPDQSRVDGIDSIKDGLQNQVRSCPNYF